MCYDALELMIQALGEELMAIKAWLELPFLEFRSSGFFFLAPLGMQCNLLLPHLNVQVQDDPK
jgi:hypothetical protein